MSADLLRRAAVKLWSCATAVPPGPWVIDSPPERLYPQRVTNPEALLIAQTFSGPEHPPAEAAYLTLLHPPVALALAAWLDAIAVETASLDEHDGFDPSLTIAGWVEACTVARAILREEATS